MLADELRPRLSATAEARSSERTVELRRAVN
jgi:predicted transcriptional regulator